ncbi:MAG: hypothetical protein KC910_32185 [Candidatus Eremiobacteraeota bacterium]|nr:hypothetical protein [Candidatus Eremiobacteraeota bacterium]
MRRGFVLVLCLLLVAIIAVMAMAVTGKRALQYRGAERQQAGAAALQLAMAGLADVRAKLDRDIFFPPVSDTQQLEFCYTEQVMDLDGVTPWGSFEVTLERSHEDKPYYLYRIISVGVYGPSERPLARRAVLAEIDIAPDLVGGKRGDDKNPATYSNPDYWNLVNFKDLGNY